MKNNKMKIMFDTNVFNKILDEIIPIQKLKLQNELFVTHIQYDEIKATNRKERRESLLAVFHAWPNTTIPTETSIWGVTKWGRGKWSGPKSMHNNLKVDLDKLNTKKLGKNANDALIAETALKNEIVLITEDPELLSIVLKYGGVAKTLDEYI